MKFVLTILAICLSAPLLADEKDHDEIFEFYKDWAEAGNVGAQYHIAQNGALARLYQNKEARPGLRVKVNAGPANPTGVGSVVRLVLEGGKLGPTRVITAGSGYWSQDSAVQVLGSKEATPTHLAVRWPGGKTTRTKIPKDFKEVHVGPDGKLIPSK